MKGNLDINKTDGYVSVSVNPRIYPLDVIFSSAYTFTDSYYIFLDGDTNEEIIVEIRTKNKKQSLEQVGREFNNELINYAAYAIQEIKNGKMRESILDRVLLTNRNPEQDSDHEENNDVDGEMESKESTENSYAEDSSSEKTDDWEFDDPEGIAVPWEEKYGKGVASETKSTDSTVSEGGSESSSEDDWEFDDPEGIAVPWEEKYGKKNLNLNEDSKTKKAKKKKIGIKGK